VRRVEPQASSLFRCVQAGWDLEDEFPAFPLVRAGVVGLGGLEPPTSSLSGIEGSTLCRPAFPQVAGERQGPRDAFLATSIQAVQADPRYATLVRDPGWPSRCAALASRLAVRGRSFGGWHHVTLVAVAHGFLTLERLRRPKPAASA
jgi:hypothetical protein